MRLVIAVFVFLVLFVGGSFAAEPVEDYGILVVAHGGSAEEDGDLMATVREAEADRPMTLGFLDPRFGLSVQQGYDDLVAQGAQRIVAVPLFNSSQGEYVEYLEILLGLRPAEDIGQTGMAHHEQTIHLQPISGPVPVVALASGLDDLRPTPDPHMVEIIESRAREAYDEQYILQLAQGYKEELVVVGRRVATPVNELPVTVEVVDREQLEAMQATIAGDALRYVPGVTVEDTGMAGQQRVVIRGIGGRRTLVLVDGERVTSQRDMSGPPILSEIDSIERIEVLKGPGSVMYGSDALAGVVNIVTRDGRLAESMFEGQVGYRFSSANDLQQPNVALRGKNDRWDYRLSWSQTDAGDRKTPDGTLENTSFSSEQGSLVLGTQVQENGRLELRAERYRSRDVEVYTGSPDLDFYLPVWDRDRLSLGYHATESVFGLDELHVKGYVQDIAKEFFNSITFPIGGGSSMRVENAFESESRIVGFDSYGMWQLSSMNFLLGLDARQEDASGPSTSDVFMIMPTGDEVPLGSDSYVPVDAKQSAAGLFGELSRPYQRGEISMGFRYEWVGTTNNASGEHRDEGSSLNDDALTGSINFLHALSDGINLVAGLASGFRSPNLQERYYESPTHSGGGITYGDPDLKAERSLQLETGLRGISARHAFQLTGFISRIDDMIATVREPNPDIPDVFDYRYTNIDNAEILGVEGGWDLMITDTLSTKMSAAWTRGEDRIEGDPIYVPPLHALLGLRWDASRFEDSLPGWLGRPWMQCDLRWMDDQDRVPWIFDGNGDRDHEAEVELASEGFVTVDLALGMDIHMGQGLSTRLVVRGNNLLDKSYDEPFTSVPQAGRHVVASLQMLF